MVEDTYTPLGPAPLFNVLSHPLRLYIFEYLCHQELTIDDLMEASGASYKSIYKQLKILEQNNLVESVLDGKYRYYMARKEALDSIEAWQQMYSVILANINS
jgi:DNA-binding transcriptional ArsR family regulator